MTKSIYPKDTKVTWVAKIRNLHPDYSNIILTVDSYDEISEVYSLRMSSGNLVFSDEESIEPYIAPTKLHLLDEITYIISKHSSPMIRYVSTTGYEVIAECRCGEEIRDEVPELFNHSTHISEEILKKVKEHGYN